MGLLRSIYWMEAALDYVVGVGGNVIIEFNDGKDAPYPPLAPPFSARKTHENQAYAIGPCPRADHRKPLGRIRTPGLD